MTRQDARFACTGLAAAVAIGLLTGAAMKPQLGIGDRPEGPQMFTFGGGARSTGPFDDGVSFTGYGENVPQYVTGSDWIAERLDELRADEPVEYAEAAPELTTATWTPPQQVEEPRAEVTFPSQAGGATYGAERPPAPAAPAASLAASPSAMPPGDDLLVTGDFTPAAEPAT